jgi:DNA-binding ferritin-like protein
LDARPGTVAAVAGQFPTGWVTDQEAIAELIGITERVAAAARGSLGDLEQTDPVGYDLTLGILEGLDKYRWMLRAQVL